MSSQISGIEPKIVWKHFYALTQIPRPSGHEAAVIEYARKFAIANDLEHFVDETGNIIIRKKAAKGKESHKGVVLQAHVDMVPQKNADKNHDFIKDPIQTIIEGNWVRADYTTLGADNGMGVAAAFAVLESVDIEHGPIEVLLTVNEETGMDGAFGLSPDSLQSEILLNLDSEEEGELFMGCAGGVDADVDWSYTPEKMEEVTGFLIQLQGLKGGHSGIDIHLGRANANKVLLQLILILQQECGTRIVKYAGGNMRNAIPREAEALLAVPEESTDIFEKMINDYKISITEKFRETDPELTLSWSKANITPEPIDIETQNRILNALNTCDNGVVSMSKVIPGVVQTSSNLSIVKIGEGRGKAQLLLRSSNDIEKRQLAEQMKDLFELSGAEVKLSGEYPGWKPNADSEVLSKAKSTYIRLSGKEPEVKVIHAGLECGIIGSKYPGLDMISFGPTIQFPHSPDERVNISSVERFWKFLIYLLEEL